MPKDIIKIALEKAMTKAEIKRQKAALAAKKARMMAYGRRVNAFRARRRPGAAA